MFEVNKLNLRGAQVALSFHSTGVTELLFRRLFSVSIQLSKALRSVSVHSPHSTVIIPVV